MGRGGHEGRGIGAGGLKFLDGRGEEKAYLRRLAEHQEAKFHAGQNLAEIA